MECAKDLTNFCPNTLEGPMVQLFLTLVSSVTKSECSLGPEGKYPPNYGPYLKDGQAFDFIVVGAGSAGSRLASRLSEENKWNVLLVEAGGYPSALTEVPALFYNIEYTDEDWHYVMQPCNTCCLGAKGRACVCPRGKVLGGSSTSNGMIYIRGMRKDFDAWAEAGNVGWDYDSVSKYFRKFERVLDQDGDYYGRDGDLEITRPKLDQPIRQVIIDGYAELGYREYKESESLGYLEGYSTIYQGTRNSAAKAFLGKAKDRENLKVAVNAQVTKVLIDPQTRVAYGVELKINDSLLELNATKEVILSAGAIDSPQILINSGVGPENHLEDLGIRIVQDLSVGEHLEDHPIFIVTMTIDSSVLKPLTEKDEVDDIYRYFQYREGALNRAGIISMYGFINTKNNSLVPNIQIMQHISYPNDTLTLLPLLKAYSQPTEVTDYILQLNKNHAIFMLMPVLLNEKSIGSVKLKTSDALDPPLIYPNYFSDSGDEDIQQMLESVRWIEGLIQTESFKKHNTKIVDLNHPNCRFFRFQTDDYWKCAIRNFASHIFHQVGTCKMGPAGDDTAVVNPRLQVYGIKGLRVADASIMPKITSANTNAPSIMIGEKAAALVKEDWLPHFLDL